MDNLIKIWFNPDKKYFEVFTAKGEVLPAIMQVTVTDNYSSEPTQPTATFTAVVNIVNEKP